jgi:hypothetical protein
MPLLDVRFMAYPTNLDRWTCTPVGAPVSCALPQSQVLTWMASIRSLSSTGEIARILAAADDLGALH